MKKILLILLFLATSRVTFAQQKLVLSAAATSCTVSNASCLVTSVDQTQGGTTFTITANASSNTIQFEASGDGGATWVAFSVTPSNSSTTVTSTASTGTWQANIAGYTNIRMRMSTLVSGTTTVSAIQSTASARSNGGGGGSGSTIFGSIIAATSFGVLANWKEFYGNNTTITVTNTSPTVTCNGCFTAATDVGKTIVATNAGGTIGADTNYLASVSLFAAGTTILSVASANSATMSTNATAGCSGTTGLFCNFAFGTNDDTAWGAVYTAFQAANFCPTVLAPVGITNWDTVNYFDLAPPNCTGTTQSNDATLTNSGATFRGLGPTSSVIVLTPTYYANLGSCTPTCMFDAANFIVKDVGFRGYGNSAAGKSNAVRIFGGGTGSYYENVTLSGFDGGDTNVNSVGAYVNYTSAMNFKTDGFGGNGVFCASYCWINGNSYVLDNFRTNFQCGGFCFSFGMGLGTGAIFVNGGTDYICGAGAHCYSTNDNIQYETGTNTHQIYQNQGGTLYITGMHMLAPVTGTTGLYFPNNNSSTYLNNTDVTGGATANAILVTGTGVKIYDGCGGTITGPVSFATSVFLPCSTTIYTVVLPRPSLSGTGSCATFGSQLGTVYYGSFACTGTTGSATFTVTPGTTATNGFRCSANDLTTAADTISTGALSVTACAFAATAIASGDVISFNMTPF